MNRQQHLLELKRELRRRKAKDDFWEYCLWSDYDFFIIRQGFLKEIAEAMQCVVEGKYKRLAVSLPPRAGKSYITSHLVAWALGRNQSKCYMRNTHTERLALKFSNDIKMIIKSELYISVFGKIEFVKDAAEDWTLKGATTGASYFCAGVGGNITGLGCNGIAIIDDSIKNFEEAASDTQLEKKIGRASCRERV